MLSLLGVRPLLPSLPYQARAGGGRAGGKKDAIAVAKGDKAKGKGKKGKGKGKLGKKGVFGVDGYYGAEEDGGDPLAWAEEQWADDGVENAGAVYV